MAQYRNRRLAEGLKKEIADIIRQMKDTRLQLVSVLAVQVDRELTQAKVYVSHFAQGKAKDETLAALRTAGGYIRSELAKKLHTRTVPELVFVDDHSIEAGFKITEMLADYEKERAQANTVEPEAE